MKQSKHPPYQDILFVDSSTGEKFVIGSTMQPTETAEHEGKTYPTVRLAVSSASHPFFTGSEKFIDSEGRVSRFAKRYQKKREQEKRDQEQREKLEKEASLKKKKKS